MNQEPSIQGSKRRVISLTRNQTDPNPEYPDLTEQQARNYAVWQNTVKIENVDVLDDVWALIHHAENKLRESGNPDDEIIETVGDGNTITYTMQEKNMALSLARSIEDAFKGFSPEVKMHNPEDNEFYRITVTLHPKE